MDTLQCLSATSQYEHMHDDETQTRSILYMLSSKIEKTVLAIIKCMVEGKPTVHRVQAKTLLYKSVMCDALLSTTNIWM